MDAAELAEGVGDRAVGPEDPEADPVQSAGYPMRMLLEGEVRVADQLWRQGTVALLEKGAFFGPLVAGPEGALLFEVFNGRPERAGQDRSGWDDLKAARGVSELPNPDFSLPEDAI